MHSIESPRRDAFAGEWKFKNCGYAMSSLQERIELLEADLTVAVWWQATARRYTALRKRLEEM